MKTIVKLTVFFCSLLVLNSCAIDSLKKIKGNRNVVEEVRTLSDSFSKIKVSNGLDVLISQGNIVKVIVEADENLLPVIKTEIIDGVLKIYTEKNIWKAKSRKIYITVLSLDAITASSGSDVVTEDFLTTENFKAKVSSGADLTVRIKAKNTIGSSSSGSDLTLIGTTERATLSSSSGSDLNASDLRAKEAVVKASSGSELSVNATENIMANASSGSDIEIKGNPKVINKKSSSGGSISKN